MSNIKIKFFDPIICSGNCPSKLSAVEAFDDYFFLGGRKYEVLTPANERREVLAKAKEVKTNKLLTIAKVVSYFTVIIPVLMLAFKAIGRSQFKFIISTEMPPGKTKPESFPKPIEGKGKEQANKELSVPKEEIPEELDPIPQQPAVEETKVYEPSEYEKKMMEAMNEFVKTEVSHIESIKAHLVLMEDKQFQEVLKSEKKVKQKFITAYKNLVEVSETLLKDSDLLSFELSSTGLAQGVKMITAFVLNKDFEKNLNTLVEFIDFEKTLQENLDKEKLTAFLESKNSQLDFAPCVILMQRLLRYKLVLEEMRKAAEKACNPVETEAIDKAIDVVKRIAVELDKNKEIEDLKKYLIEYKSAKKNPQAMEKSLQDISYYLSQKKVYSLKPIPKAKLSVKDYELQDLRKKLVACDIDLKLAKAKQAKDWTGIVEAVEMALPWIDDEKLKKLLQKKLKEVPTK